jgi:hypothetical protein
MTRLLHVLRLTPTSRSWFENWFSAGVHTASVISKSASARFWTVLSVFAFPVQATRRS